MTRTYHVTDSWDGRTIERLTRVSTRKLARKHAQRIADAYGDQVTLIETRDDPRGDLVALFQPKEARR